MSAQLATAPPTAATPANDALYYRAILHALIDMGADIARTVHAQTHPTPIAEPTDPTIPFDRIARAIRRTIILARKVAEPLPTQTAADPAQHRTAARARIIREVEDAIQRRSSDSDAAALHAELLDRLDSPDLDDDIASRPASDIIADICRDLGIAAVPGMHCWKRRTPDDISLLCRRALASPTAAPRTAPTGVRAAPPPPQPGTGPPSSPTKASVRD